VRFWPLLADYAQALNGKLYVMGAGWNKIGGRALTCALAGVLELDWDEANRPRQLRIELVTEDGRPVNVGTVTGDRPFVIEANVEVGRPPGTRPGTQFNVPIAINIAPIPMPAVGQYVWRFSFDGAERDEWRLPFSVAPAADAPPQP